MKPTLTIPTALLPGTRRNGSPEDQTTKRILTLLLTALLALAAALPGADVEDQRESVPPSDLIYDRPAATPDAGQPLGNGRMGTMVWTSPEAIHLQINRADLGMNMIRSFNGLAPRRLLDFCAVLGCLVDHLKAIGD